MLQMTLLDIIAVYTFKFSSYYSELFPVSVNSQFTFTNEFLGACINWCSN